MVISSFSGRVQFTALSISFQFVRMARAKFPKMSLVDVLKEVIEWGSIIKSVKSEIRLKKSKYLKFVQNVSRKRRPIIFWKAATETCSKI